MKTQGQSPSTTTIIQSGELCDKQQTGANNDFPLHLTNSIPDCDGAITVATDAMEPALFRGDTVFYKTTKASSVILWGQVYLIALNIDGNTHTTIGHLLQSDKQGYYKLTHNNPRYSNRDIAVATILSLALVKASLHINALN